MRWILLFLMLLPLPAAADELCHDLWFTRNLIMDRAGYCFGSTLGKTVFDNRDCVGKQVSISRKAQRRVALLQENERIHSCRVNTSQTRLELPDIEIRRRLRDLPIRDEFESGCIGWLEPVTPLYAGRGANTDVIGRIEPNDDVMYSHGIEDGWSYVTVHRPTWDGLKSGGWLRDKNYNCRQWAG